MRGKYFFVLGLIFLAVVVSAGFEFDDYNISDVYGEDSEISGWIEIGFEYCFINFNFLLVLILWTLL
ncbi:MAG: hypothetical protein GY834_03760 [Bacteroidetes bacterium]|nr:hypothetical protein [Bacteroidota bacterium]